MSNLRKSANGKDCMVRLPQICNFNPETTVLAHINGAGMGQKMPDFLGAWCCSNCHEVLDGGMPEGVRFTERMSNDEKRLAHLDGVVRTQLALHEEGYGFNK